jgi:hypothetical protein
MSEASIGSFVLSIPKSNERERRERARAVERITRSGDRLQLTPVLARFQRSRSLATLTMPSTLLVSVREVRALFPAGAFL